MCDTTTTTTTHVSAATDSLSKSSSAPLSTICETGDQQQQPPPKPPPRRKKILKKWNALKQQQHSAQSAPASPSISPAGSLKKKNVLFEPQLGQRDRAKSRDDSDVIYTSLCRADGTPVTIRLHHSSSLSGPRPQLQRTGSYKGGRRWALIMDLLSPPAVSEHMLLKRNASQPSDLGGGESPPTPAGPVRHSESVPHDVPHADSPRTSSSHLDIPTSIQQQSDSLGSSWVKKLSNSIFSLGNHQPSFNDKQQQQQQQQRVSPSSPDSAVPHIQVTTSSDSERTRTDWKRSRQQRKPSFLDPTSPHNLTLSDAALKALSEQWNSNSVKLKNRTRCTLRLVGLEHLKNAIQVSSLQNPTVAQASAAGFLDLQPSDLVFTRSRCGVPSKHAVEFVISCCLSMSDGSGDIYLLQLDAGTNVSRFETCVKVPLEEMESRGLALNHITLATLALIKWSQLVCGGNVLFLFDGWQRDASRPVDHYITPFQVLLDRHRVNHHILIGHEKNGGVDSLSVGNSMFQRLMFSPTPLNCKVTSAEWHSLTHTINNSLWTTLAKCCSLRS